MKKRLECIVHGRVQGVTFRDFTRRTATRLGLSGFVRNLPDETVEVVAEGEEDNLKKFLRTLKEDHPYADVEGVAAVWGQATGEFDEFRIR